MKKLAYSGSWLYTVNVINDTELYTYKWLQ